MKKFFLLLISVFVSASFLQANYQRLHEVQEKAINEGDAFVHSYTKSGNILVFVLDGERIDLMPEWRGEGDPPLSMSEAIEIAEKYKKDDLSQNLYSLKLVTLKKIDLVEQLDRWCYQLHYAKKKPHDTLVVVVLMDGTILEPRELSEDK